MTHKIIGCAMEVHREVGPGLLESVYDDCMCRELKREGLVFTRQTSLKVTYAGAVVGQSYRPDFVVEGAVVVELKSVSSILPVHIAQVLSYMKLSTLELGLIINFNVEYLIRGVKRLILTRSSAAP
ncbi:MAG: GxxExxY protein [Gemmatimonadaceae bacterium]